MSGMIFSSTEKTSFSFHDSLILLALRTQAHLGHLFLLEFTHVGAAGTGMFRPKKVHCTQLGHAASSTEIGANALWL